MSRYAFVPAAAALLFATAAFGQQLALEMWRHASDSRHFDRSGLKSELIGQGAAVEVRKGGRVVVSPQGDFRFALRSIGPDPILGGTELFRNGESPIQPDGLSIAYNPVGVFLTNGTNRPIAVVGAATVLPAPGGVRAQAGYTCLLPAGASVHQPVPAQTIAVIIGAGSAAMVRSLGPDEACGGRRPLFRV